VLKLGTTLFQRSNEQLRQKMTNKNQCKRFGIFVKILAIAALAFCLPAVAQEQNAWQFGSVPANSSISKPDDQQVYEILLKMLDRWNAHDIEGHLEAYWKSSELLVVIDSEQFNGWQQLHDSYVHGYPGATEMGSFNPTAFKCGYSSRTSHSL
jgi:hypothetical protein